MTRTTVLLGVACVISFLAARALRTEHMDDRGPALARTATRDATASGAPGAGLAGRSAMRIASVASQRVPPAAQRALEQEIRATLDEAPAAAELRHERQLATIQERAPELASTLTRELVRGADTVAGQQRTLRASFMLGEISEDEYLDRRRDAIRDGFRTARALLSKEQFAKVFQWDSDADPFDPEGSVQRPATSEEPGPAALDDRGGK